MLDLSRLTEEQRRVVLAPDGPLLVVAGPGSGKTTVLAGRIAHLVQERDVGPDGVLALAFSTAAARELRARLARVLGEPGRAVGVGTFHALGLRIVRTWADELGYGPGPVTVYDRADALALLREAAGRVGVDPDRWPAHDLWRALERHRLRGDDADPEGLAGLAAAYEALLRRRHAVDYPAMLALPLRLFAEHPRALRLLQDAQRHVLADEAQDLCGAQRRLLHLLCERHRNLVVVGDPWQCVSEDTLVATPDGDTPIGRLRTGDAILAAAGRGRATTVRVRSVLTRRFDGELLRVTLSSGRVLRVTPDHMCFARLGVRRNLYYVYLMYRRDLGYRIGISVGAHQEKCTGRMVSGLLSRTIKEGADRAWVLRVCSSRAEAWFYEQLLSVRYGIPTAIFRAQGALQLLDQAAINRLFGAVDTRTSAARLMADVGLHEHYPHHRPQAFTLGGAAHRLPVHLAMFGGNGGSLRSPWSTHRLWLNSSDRSVREELERRGLRARTGSRGTWRIERLGRDLAAVSAAAEQLAGVAGGSEVARWAKLTRGPRFAFQPASHLHPGMIVPTLRNGDVVDDEIVSVEREPYSGAVYDLDVEHVHNYAASGVVVHNCLFSWRGADARFVEAFRQAFPEARVLHLTENFRATGRLVELANALGAPLGDRRLWTRNPPGQPAVLHGAADERAEADYAAERIAALRRAGLVAHPGEVAVVYRTNRQADELALALRARRIPYRVRGVGDPFARREVRDALAYLRLALDPADGAALARIVNSPPRRLGRLAAALRDSPRAPAELPVLARRYGPAALAAADALAALVDELHAASQRLAPDALLDLAIEKSGYRAWLLTQPDGAVRTGHLDDLQTMAARAGADLAGWLDEVGAELDVPPEAPAVLLTTIHLAKGAEWRAVFVVGAEDGLLPHARALAAIDGASLEEELRAMYVAVTRACERLFVTFARTRRLGGRTNPRQPSRFLRGLPAAVLAPAQRAA